MCSDGHISTYTGIFLGTRHAPLARWSQNWRPEPRTEAPGGALEFWLTRHNGLSLKCSCNLNPVILNPQHTPVNLSYTISHYGK